MASQVLELDTKNMALETTLDELYKTLTKLSIDIIAKDDNTSTWKMLQEAFEKSPANNKDQLFSLNPYVILAYYIVKKIEEVNAFDGNAVSSTFKGLIQALDGKDLTDINAIKSAVAEYIQNNKLKPAKEFTDMYCHAFVDTYKILEFVTVKYQESGLLGDAMHPHYRIGNAAFILEHLYTKCVIKKEKSNESVISFELSLGQLQNLFIDEVVLGFLQGKKFSFMTETRYTLKEILELDKCELFAWYIVNQEQIYAPAIYDNQKDLLEFLKTKAQKYIEDTKKITISNKENMEQITWDMKVLQYYLTELNKIKHNRFEDTHIFIWLLQLQKVMSIYNHYTGLMGNTLYSAYFDIEDIKDKKDKVGKLNCRLLVIGDSVSVGVGLKTECYVKIIPHLLKKHFNINLDIVNCSVIGCKTSHGVQMIQRELKAIEPDIVLVSLGGNDAFEQTNVNEILDNLKKMVKACEKRKVVVALGIPETFNLREDYRKEFVEILPKLKKEYSEIETVWLPDELLKKENIQPDGMHLKSEIQLPLATVAADALIPACSQLTMAYATNFYYKAALELQKYFKELKFVECIVDYSRYYVEGSQYQKTITLFRGKNSLYRAKKSPATTVSDNRLLGQTDAKVKSALTLQNRK